MTAQRNGRHKPQAAPERDGRLESRTCLIEVTTAPSCAASTGSTSPTCPSLDLYGANDRWADRGGRVSTMVHAARCMLRSQWAGLHATHRRCAWLGSANQALCCGKIQPASASRGEAMDRRTQTARSFLDGRCNASLQKGKGAMRAPHCLHTDWTHRCHICAGTGRSATAASTLSSP